MIKMTLDPGSHVEIKFGDERVSIVYDDDGAISFNKNGGALYQPPFWITLVLSFDPPEIEFHTSWRYARSWLFGYFEEFALEEPAHTGSDPLGRGAMWEESHRHFRQQLLLLPEGEEIRGECWELDGSKVTYLLLKRGV